jgi:hypothetical protein
MKAAVRATGEDRNTAFVCANMDRSEKMPLLVEAKVIQACEVPAMYIRT